MANRPVRPLCPGSAGKKKPCYARMGSAYCSNHDPDQAARRSAAGARRSGGMRLQQLPAPVIVDGVPFDHSKVPTIGKLIDRLISLADQVEERSIEPKVAFAAVSALKAAHQALVIERDRADRIKSKPGADQSSSLHEVQEIPAWLQQA